jgi:purine-nucleoside phosphorylase
MKFEFVERAKTYLLDKIGAVPEIAVIMGSGMSALDEILLGAARIHYISIPHFPIPKVAGHRGQVVYGKASGNLTVIVFEGRVHYYEGNTMDDVTFCTRVIGRLGVHTLIVTNASGAINPAFAPGELMIIKDHINLMPVNPLSGPNEERWGPRFVDQTEVYDSQFRQRLRNAGEYCGLSLREGVYAAMAGPTYETPAEIQYLRTIGADAVGMSTVPEAIVAKHMGLKIGGLSMLANVAAGMSGMAINHEDVLASAGQMNADLAMLLQRLFKAAAAREQALALYSGFKVGAALETSDGRIYTGCNIENASYGLTVCAERVALWKALSEGVREFSRIAVVTNAPVITSPCGACRQLLWEYCGNIPVLLHSLKGIDEQHQLADLFPLPFDKTRIASV